MSESNSLRLEPDIVVFPSTYISSIAKTTLKIISSDPKNIHHYEWRRYSSDDDEKRALSSLDMLNPSDREQISTLRLFSSPILRIYPTTGEIWPKGTEQIYAEFQPNQSQTQMVTAYLYDIELGIRKPYRFECEGIPATAEFNIDQVNLGHVSLEKRYEYKVILRNTGKIPLDFQLMQKTLQHLVIDFTPSKGHLDVGESVPIIIMLEANHVGQFNETYEYKILGINDRPSPRISLYGRVIGPSFSVSTKKVEFGTVSYGFLYTQEFEINNTSDIPLDYSLNFQPNKNFELREFKIIPNNGSVPKFTKQKVRIDFIPVSLQNYNVQLFLDSERFEDRLFSMQITATCVCPEITFRDPVIDLGDIFMKHTYQTKIVLQNRNKFPAKFEFVESDDESTLEASVSLGKFSGIIIPSGDSEVPVFVTPLQLGHLKVSRFIRIFGSNQPPLMFTFRCLCTGPRVKLSSENVDFGVINVLQDTTVYLEVFNDSLIAAPFHAEIESRTQCFQIPIVDYEMLPGEKYMFPIKAYLDDTLNFVGKLTFSFKLLTPIALNVIAKGKGSAIVSSIEMNLIDMNFLFTGKAILKKFVLTNHSRRKQTVKWTQNKPEVEQTTSTSAYFTYAISPDECTLEPGEVVPFEIKFDSNLPCKFNFVPLCEVTIEKVKNELFKPTIKGEFIKPTIKFDQDSIMFRYEHDSKKEEEISNDLNSRSIISPSTDLLKPITVENTITNVSELPLIVTASVQPPFFLSVNKFSLESLQKNTFSIIFKPDFKKDFTSQTIDNRIIFALQDNPHQFFINLRANMVFPNLSFSQMNINFGSLLRHTDESKVIKVKNTSEVPVSYFWELLPKRKEVDISKIFDVYPIRGDLEVGETAETHIAFFALELENNYPFHEGLAVCHVIGGPDYTIDLKGSSCLVEYQLGPKLIDFGVRYFADVLRSSFILANSSDISLTYRVKVPKGCGFSEINVEPLSGKLDVGKQQSFNVTVVPGFPQKFKESFFVQVGKVDEAELAIEVDSSFPQIQTDLPRSEDDGPTVMAQQILTKLIRNTPMCEIITRSEEKIFIDRLTEQRNKNLTSYKNILKKQTTNLSKIVGYNGFILSRFELDFGLMTLGEIKSFTYTLKSISEYPISFEILISSIQGTGFLIEPTSFTNVPKNAEIQLNISFDAQRRTISTIGNERYQIPIVFSCDLASMLTLKITTAMPTISVSNSDFDFEPTLLGQSRTMTLQVSNPIKIPVEFSIGEAQSTPILQRSKDNEAKNVFVASPTSGILPPASFQNIEINFSPQADKSYSMQIPVKVKHNTETLYFTVKGVGVQMKVNFSVSDIKFGTNKLFEETNPTMEVEIINPCDFPIVVFSPQFDLQILNDQLKFQFDEMTELEGTTIVMPQPQIEANAILDTAKMLPVASRLSIRGNISPHANVSKFSMCIIVNGPPLSGKTTMSNFISEYLGGIPVVSLKDIWKEYIESPYDVSEETLINSFREATSKGECVRGFVVDGLNVFAEPPETEVAMLAMNKNKHMTDDLSKNPFAVVPGEPQTAVERALSCLLSGLSGQYVFQIALQANDDAIQKHMLMSVEQNKKQRENEEVKEIERILNMDEFEYLKLSEEEQEIIDKKRLNYRQRKLNDVEAEMMMMMMNARNDASATNHSNTKGAKSARTQRSRLSSASKNRRGGAAGGSNNAAKKVNAKGGKKGNLSNDPVQFGIQLFTFSLGRVALLLQMSTGNFQAVDSEIIKGSKCQNAKIQNMNSVCLDSNNDIEQIQEQIKEFLPELKDIKEKALTQLMPQEQVFIPNFFAVGEVPRLMEPPKHFSIVNDVPAGEFPNFERYATAPKQPQNPSQKGEKSSAKKGKIVKDTSLIDNLNILNYTKRWLLESGAREKIVVQFIANEVGKFDDNLCFCIENCRNDLFKLRVRGYCVYPDVDRSTESVFQGKVVPEVSNKSEFNFIKDIDEFQFGPLTVAAKDKGKKDPCLYNQPLFFKNNSPFDVELTCILVDNPAKSPWKLSQNNLVVPKGETGELEICIHPLIPDTYRATLEVFVKDNPEPFFFKFFSEVFQPSLEVSTTNLDFEKLLLCQEKKNEIIIKNTLKIPSFWRIKSPAQFSGMFKFSENEGNIQPRGQTKLVVTYSSNKPVVAKKQMQIDVLDKSKQKTYFSHHISLLAESFDLPFEFLYPKGFDHLDVGTMKVNQSKVIQCTLKNKGKYPSFFKITYAKPKFENFLKISTTEGLFQPADKPLQINFTFCGPKVCKHDHEKYVTITFFEPEQNQEVANFDIFLTGRTVYNEYTLEPSSPIDFGSISIGETVTKEWTIRNTGFFPFDFEISPKIEEPTTSDKDDTSSQVTTASSRTRAHVGGRGRGRQSVRAPTNSNANSKDNLTIKSPKRPKNTKEIQIGNFYVSLSSGTIQPDSHATMKIDYIDNEARKSESTLVLKINGVSPKDAASKSGRYVQLIGKSFVPGIRTKDYEMIFPNQQLCLRYDLQKKDTTAFLEDDQLFHFAPNIINNSHPQTVNIALKNANPVPCTVDATVKPNQGYSKSSASKKQTKLLDQNFPFELSAVSIAIPPLEQSDLSLTFNPKIEGTFTGIFEATVRNGTNPETRMLKFGVEGVGTVPTFRLGDNYGNIISFGKTLINTRKEKKLALVNDGVIPTRIKFSASNSADFAICVVDKVVDNFTANSEIEIEPMKTFLFGVTFSPTAVKTAEFTIEINAVYNAKCSYKLNFAGEGFMEDIVFEGIPGDDNNLYFRDNVVGRNQEQIFVMHNVCDDDARFQWDEHPDYVFSPRVGHLRKGKSKQIKVTFYSEVPLSYENAKILCKWSKIKLIGKNPPDWDDSMKTVTFVPRNQLMVPNLLLTPTPPDSKLDNGKSRTIVSGRKFPPKKPQPFNRTNLMSPRRKGRKENSPFTSTNSVLPPLQSEDANELVNVVEIKPEPSYAEIPGRYNDLILMVSAVSDYIRYETSTNEISFESTMMYETRVAEVEIRNTSTIRFDYSWVINKFSALHSDYALTHRNPFSVIPNTGFIPAGETGKFQIRFMPEEVDDFSSHITCEIPFLSQLDPPDIFVTGYSKRPLCHFSVDLSDYISANRRHPDYTFQLPADVKVIELFASGIGQRAVKKFQVINATSHPYEIIFENDIEHRSPTITCETTRALVSSGKRYTIAFSYNPTSLKTIESYWIFTIPEHGIVVPFLVVGRIMPH